MLKDKTIKVFDVDNIKRGSFVTFRKGFDCNGIIYKVSESYITITTVGGEKVISIGEIISGVSEIIAIKESIIDTDTIEECNRCEV